VKIKVAQHINTLQETCNPAYTLHRTTEVITNQKQGQSTYFTRLISHLAYIAVLPVAW